MSNPRTPEQARTPDDRTPDDRTRETGARDLVAAEGVDEGSAESGTEGLGGDVAGGAVPGAAAPGDSDHGAGLLGSPGTPPDPGADAPVPVESRPDDAPLRGPGQQLAEGEG